MSENENNKNVDDIRHLLTLNEISTSLGVGTYNTIKKIVSGMNLNTGEVIRNGRSFTAYYISGAELNYILKHFQNKNNIIANEKMAKHTVKKETEALLYNKSENVSENEINVKKRNELSSDKIIELMDIKHKLEAENMTLTKELSEIRVNYAKVEADKTVLDGQMRYITDKQTHIEAENARLNQDITKLNKEINTKRNIIFILIAVLLVLCTFAFAYILFQGGK